MKGKKVGIVTFGNNVNYGGALQEYALYVVLKDAYPVKAVWYDDPLIRANSQPVRYGFFTAALMILKGELGTGASKGTTEKGEKNPLAYMAKEGVNQLKVLCSDLLHVNSRKKLVKNFNDFFETCLERTPRYTLDDFRKQRYERFDVLISGSDQIWNPKTFGLSEVYFLGFDQGKSQKVSYASSFGNFDFPEGSFTTRIGEYLSDYSAVSVREAGSVARLKEQYGIDAQLVLDPTLLLDRAGWFSALGLKENERPAEKYLLVYMLGNKKNVLSYAKKAAKRLGLRLYVLDQRPAGAGRDVRYFSQAGPREFVELIANASFVVTNSFHGTAFSLNFNIPFYSVSSLVPERVESLLDKVGLRDRILPYKPELDESFNPKVDFTRANRLLDEQREGSRRFLFEAIEKAGEGGGYPDVSGLEKHKCCGCSACASVCPANCIRMEPDEEGFLYPAVDRQACIRCVQCLRVCPSLNVGESNLSFETFICKSREEAVRQRASSGGVFLPLAEKILAQGGAVAGAAMENLRCVHKTASTAEGCAAFCGSKYVQSDMGRVFAEVKELLEASRPVLFTGTPCQVAGLKRYLKKDYPQLYCIDFICHGVPSPGVFERYIREQQEKYGGTIENVAFRHKGKDWMRISSMKYTFSNGDEEYVKEDRYMLGFLMNLFLRPSCHSCRANKFRSGSDLTIADYWGAVSKYGRFYDRKGVSLVIAKTEKGKRLFQSAADRLEFMEAQIGHAAKFQENLFTSSRANRNRQAFFRDFRVGKSFSELAQSYVREYPAYRIKKHFGTELPFRVYNLLKKEEKI